MVIDGVMNDGMNDDDGWWHECWR